MPILFSTVESRSKYDLSFKLQSQIKTNFYFLKQMIIVLMARERPALLYFPPSPSIQSGHGFKTLIMISICSKLMIPQKGSERAIPEIYTYQL